MKYLNTSSSKSYVSATVIALILYFLFKETYVLENYILCLITLKNTFCILVTADCDCVHYDGLKYDVRKVFLDSAFEDNV